MIKDFKTRVYHLGNHSETVKGVAMAKCSRSTNTFEEDARGVSFEQANSFNERVVANYGHESVAEMAVGSPVLEGISILLAEDFLNLQTGHYQGKSSRYQVYTRENTVNPFKPDTEPHQILQEAYDKLFDAYEGLYPKVYSYCEKILPEEKPHVVTARALDALRGLLPLGTRTNFAARLTGRDISYQVRMLLSHPLAEARHVGEKLKIAGEHELGPALVRHAEAHPLISGYQFSPLPGFIRESPKGPWVKLDNTYLYQPQEVARAWSLENYGVLPSIGQVTAQLTEVLEILNGLLEMRTRRQDPLPHCLRAARYRFEIVADFGVWKDLHRHRRCEIFRGPFTVNWGFGIPDDLTATGDSEVLETYQKAMQAASEAYMKLQEHDFHAAQYAVAQGHYQNWVMDMDLEQLYYLCELRTQPAGHISYRRVAYQMYDLIKQSCPQLVQHMLVHQPDKIEVHA